jgi:hypothetical protein
MCNYIYNITCKTLMLASMILWGTKSIIEEILREGVLVALAHEISRVKLRISMLSKKKKERGVLAVDWWQILKV